MNSRFILHQELNLVVGNQVCIHLFMKLVSNQVRSHSESQCFIIKFVPSSSFFIESKSPNQVGFCFVRWVCVKYDLVKLLYLVMKLFRV